MSRTETIATVCRERKTDTQKKHALAIVSTRWSA